MHKLQYKFFIADGDSSTFAHIRTEVSYGQTVEKIDCTNHVAKNYSKHLYKVQDDECIPAAGRKILTASAIKGLVDLAKHNINHNSEHETVDSLKQDLANGPHHYFGEHQNCRTYYCDSKPATNKVEELKSLSIFQRIESCVELIIKKANLLIQNQTNNAAETFMSLLAKYNAGKRLNLTMRGSFENQCQIAGLAYNHGPKWLQKAWRNTVKESPGQHFNRFVAKKIRQQQYKRYHPTSKRKLWTGQDKQEENHEYGINAIEPELLPHVLDNESERIINKLQVTEE